MTLKFYLSLLSLFLFQSAYSQSSSYSIKEIGENFIFGYDEKFNPSIYKDSFQYRYLNGTFVKNKISFPFESIVFETPKSQEDFTSITTNENQFFVLNGLGIVLQLDNNGFKRIDTSSELRNNFGSVFFNYNGSIYSHGGYGFWMYHNFIVNYNFTSRQWQSIQLDSSDIPKGRAYHYGAVNKDSFIFFGGRLENTFSDEIYSLDLLKFSYKKLGRLNSGFDFSFGSPKIYTDLDSAIKLYFDNRKNKILAVDYDKLRFSVVDYPSDKLELIDVKYPLVSSNDSIYFISKNKEDRLMVGVSKRLIKKQINSWTPLLRPWDRFKNFLLIPIVIFVILLSVRLFILFKQKTKIITSTVLLQDHYLTYKGELIILKESETNIILNLIDNGSIKLTELLALEQFEKYSKQYGQGLIFDLLAGLKQKIEDNKTISQKIKIQILPNPKDKREKIVTLKGGIYPYNGLLNYIIKGII